VVLFLVLSPALVWPQTEGSDKPSGQADEQQTQQSGSSGASALQSDAGARLKLELAVPAPALVHTPTGQDADNFEAKQTKRILWIVPNFSAVSANTELPRLSVRGKFALATLDSVDYSSFAWAAVLAGQSMGLNSYPELHQGAAGYGRYYWRAFADQASGSFFTEAIVPTVTHEDPRYYTLGHGGFSAEQRTPYPRWS
jgi:hypothetical protein